MLVFSLCPATLEILTQECGVLHGGADTACELHSHWGPQKSQAPEICRPLANVPALTLPCGSGSGRAGDNGADASHKEIHDQWNQGCSIIKK